MRYSKAQRPTSLPIQPFVLIPADKPKSQHLGCLLEQYMNQKASFKPSLKFKEKSSRCFSDLQPSSVNSHCPIFLEAPSSSDTCSTCTPSPEHLRRTWSQSGRSQGHTSQWTSKSSPYSGNSDSVLQIASNLLKIPTYQDLLKLNPAEQSHSKTTKPPTHTYDSVFFHTPPTLPLTTETHYPNLQVCFSPPTSFQPENKFAQFQAASDSGFSHSGFTAALSSVPPLSSLSSLLSLAASGLHPQQTQNSAELRGRQSQSQHSEHLMLSDRPPTDFCLSPDASYESMSISHLQRRGEDSGFTGTHVTLLQ